jgi:hypothetical protein
MRFNIDCGLWIGTPICGCAPRVAAPLASPQWAALTVYAEHDRFDGSRAVKCEYPHFEAAITEDFPAEFDKIRRPEPLHAAFRPDFVDHHRLDGGKIGWLGSR